MTDSVNLSDLHSNSLDFDRQRFLQKWLMHSRPHMATTTFSSATDEPQTVVNVANTGTHQNLNIKKYYIKELDSSKNHATSPYNQAFFLMSSNEHTSAGTGTGTTAAGTHNKLNGIGSKSSCVTPIGGGGGSHLVALGHHIEGRKPKLRRFNSHDASTNMFSVADFENARLARRNEIELKQRLQRRMRGNCNGVACTTANGSDGTGNVGTSSCVRKNSSGPNQTRGDCSTGDSKMSKTSNDSQHEPIPADVFFNRYSLPAVVRISYKTNSCNETLQSFSSNGSSSGTSHSSTLTGHNADPSVSNSMGIATSTSSSTNSSSSNINPNGTHCEENQVSISTDAEKLGELFLLYKFINQRCIFHGHNTKTVLTNRKKAVLLPQEFPGYFSMVNDKGLTTATQYTSLVQLVRERIFKFISVDAIQAFAETQGNQTQLLVNNCCHPYSPEAPKRPQYVRTTARAGEVYRLIAVFEDGKQEHSGLYNGLNSSGTHNSTSYNKPGSQGREKERGRYAQIINDGRQVFYVPLSTRGKFYEVEPGVPVILQKIGGNEKNKKVNPECVYRITDLVTPQKKIPLNLKFISGSGNSATGIPENMSITKVTREDIFIACPIEYIEMKRPLHLRKLYLTREMHLLKSSLGFENDKTMWSDHNIQNVLRFCQFNCDKFLQTVEVETMQGPNRSNSKQRAEGLKLLKPLYLPKLLRREKTAISAHEKEDSIIFLTKTDLAKLEVKENVGLSINSGRLDVMATGNRISEKMKVFQSTKKKWFRKSQNKSVNSLTTLDLDVQVKRMSMERYTDMSKLLQERFGGNSNCPNTRSPNLDASLSEPSFTDTDTTALTTITAKLKKLEHFGDNEKGPEYCDKRTINPISLQKSLSLQDIINPELKLTTVPTADSISETFSDLAEVESCKTAQTGSFFTEKLYNEFHVKTKQYSKSSSSLHQLLNFSLPQKMRDNDHKSTLSQFKQNLFIKLDEKSPNFNIGAPVTGRRFGFGRTYLNADADNAQNTSLILTPTTSSFMEDELPYSSVRDSLILSSNDVNGLKQENGNENYSNAFQPTDYTKENIYSEICHEASAMGGIPSSQTRDTIEEGTQSTQISSDDFGDYASLSSPPSLFNCNQQCSQAILGNAITRVQINCTSSPVSYHTVYLGNESVGEQHVEERQIKPEAWDPSSSNSHKSQHMYGLKHITTVELEGLSDSINVQELNSITGSGDTNDGQNIKKALK